jgi:hypothetical protein
MSGCIENPVAHTRAPAPRRGTLSPGRRGPASTGLASTHPTPSAEPSPAAAKEPDSTDGNVAIQIPSAALMAAPADDLNE